jgi:hypothetical protein
MAVVSGGTTLIDNGALDAGVPTGSLILLSTQTASASASISFTSDIDSTYDSYVFKFIDIHPSTTTDFAFNMSTDGGSNYNVVKTTTHFSAYHTGGSSNLGYRTSLDLAQSTAFQPLAEVQTTASYNTAGTLHLFNPSSTTFVKLFVARLNDIYSAYSEDRYTAGYGNTTSAVDAVQFKMLSGTFDGTIKMYGVK